MCGNLEYWLGERQSDDPERQQAQFRHRQSLAATGDGKAELREGHDGERHRSSAGEREVSGGSLVDDLEPDGGGEGNQGDMKQDEPPALPREDRLFRRSLHDVPFGRLHPQGMRPLPESHAAS